MTIILLAHLHASTYYVCHSLCTWLYTSCSAIQKFGKLGRLWTAHLSSWFNEVWPYAAFNHNEICQISYENVSHMESTISLLASILWVPKGLYYITVLQCSALQCSKPSGNFCQNCMWMWLSLYLFLHNYPPIGIQFWWKSTQFCPNWVASTLTCLVQIGYT